MKNSRKVKISTFGSQITSAISVALVLVLLGIMAMMVTTSHRLVNDIRSNVGIIVKMLPAAADAEIDRVQKLINRQAGVASIEYSSPEKILADESEIMGENLAAILDQNPFGGEFDVRLLPKYAVSDSIEIIAKAIANDPSIDEIVTETAVVDNINAVLHRLTMVLLIIAIAMLIISFVLINNTVSLAVYSRRFIIHTMKLVGATSAFIRRPFLIAGIITGAVSAIVAIGLISALRAYASTFDPIVEDILVWKIMGCIFAGLLILGPMICLTASAIATNKYLRSGYDEMFK